MNPQQIALRNKQRERRQRGNDFQAEIRDSWRLVPNTWRMRISDGVSSTRPADELVLTEEVNILAEHKRTEGTKFELSFLRPNQIQGLIDFDEVVKRNVGLVFVSFHNRNQQRDEAFVLRLVTALRYLRIKERQYISLSELQTGISVGASALSMRIPRLEQGSKLYDLREVPRCCKSL